ncbi:MAG: hypothetical protein DHS20C18_33480 [Saprospiraceae bacterium]|nr:MAG: hypothetical protein DHS20C18_33480 [Saprospiraceae bacterium]
MKITHTFFLLVLLCSTFTLTAQSALTEHTLALDRPENVAKANVQDFNWMAGRWEGQGFGGTVEENWNPPVGSTMLGSFRLVTEGEPSFYELLVLMPEGESVVYKVKHFNPDLTGWEEKEKSVAFPLVKLSQDTAWFNGLTVIRDGDLCTHYLAMKGKDGTHKEAKLEYRRRDQPVSLAEQEVVDMLPKVDLVPLLLLGSYHMSNPGLDMFNMESDDVQAPKRQKEIQAVVDRLALWRPTKVAVEAPYGDSATIARYQDYLRGKITLRNSEEEQIGFRLAKQLGHKTIYPIDVRLMLNDDGISEIVGSNPEKYGPYMANLEIIGKSAMAVMSKWLKEGTIGSMLYNMNDPFLNEVSHAFYFQAFVPIVKDDNYAGTNMVNDWYNRNLRIFSNLHQINDRPDDRIFIVYGAGHVPLLQQFAEDSPYFRVDQVQDYLRGL